MLIIRKHGVGPPLTGRGRKSEVADPETKRAVTSWCQSSRKELPQRTIELGEREGLILSLCL